MDHIITSTHNRKDTEINAKRILMIILINHLPILNKITIETVLINHNMHKPTMSIQDIQKRKLGRPQTNRLKLQSRVTTILERKLQDKYQGSHRSNNNMSQSHQDNNKGSLQDNNPVNKCNTIMIRSRGALKKLTERTGQR